MIRAALACLLALGCADRSEPPGSGASLSLRVGGPFAAESLRTWVMGAPAPADHPLGDGEARDLSADPATVELVVGRAAGGGGEVRIHLAALAGESPVAVKDLRLVLPASAPVLDVELEVWSVDCDMDLDTFRDCAREGCCPTLSDDDRAAVTDCLDDPSDVTWTVRDGGCDAVPTDPAAAAADAHAFQPQDADRCDDCIDQDCSEGDLTCPISEADPGPAPAPEQREQDCPLGTRAECYPLEAPACQGNWACVDGACEFDCRGAFDGQCHPADCGEGETCVEADGWRQCVDCARVQWDCGYWNDALRRTVRELCAYAGACVCRPDADGCTPYGPEP